VEEGFTVIHGEELMLDINTGTGNISREMFGCNCLVLKRNVFMLVVVVRKRDLAHLPVTTGRWGTVRGNISRKMLFFLRTAWFLKKSIHVSCLGTVRKRDLPHLPVTTGSWGTVQGNISREMLFLLEIAWFLKEIHTCLLSPFVREFFPTCLNIFWMTSVDPCEGKLLKTLRYVEGTLVQSSGSCRIRHA
jgi:hypothetical protein